MAKPGSQPPGRTAEQFSMSSSTSPDSARNSSTNSRDLLNRHLSKLRTQTSAKKLSGDLKAFVHGAWPVLEPITKLSWNWHLDLICEYLTLIKEDRFRQVCGAEIWSKSGGRYYMLPYRMHERLDFGPTKSAIQACHAAFPRAHAILIEDKANGPAIISELQQVIPGIIAIDPEGGKVARAHSISPLWEAGSIVLPDPQVFDGHDAAHPQANWVEEYIHNICTFPQAVHDDDMDATSQALIYMRHKMGGGILDFYRGQADQQIASNNVARGLPPKKGARVPETRLTQSIKDAMNISGTILCSRNQYPEVRQALLDVGSESALAEVQRMDAKMEWGRG